MAPNMLTSLRNAWSLSSNVMSWRRNGLWTPVLTISRESSRTAMAGQRPFP